LIDSPCGFAKSVAKTLNEEDLIKVKLQIAQWKKKNL